MPLPAYHHLSIYALCLTMTFGCKLLAAEETDDTTSSVYLTFGRDEVNNTDILFGTNIDFSNHLQLGLGMSQSRDDSDENSTKQKYISFGSNPYELISVEFAMNNANQTSRINSTLLSLLRNLDGDSAKLESTKYALTTTLTTDNWQFNLAPSYIDIGLSLPGDTELTLNAKAVQLAISYFGFENYFVSASAFHADFSEITATSTAGLQRRLTRLALGAIAKTSASTIEARRYSIGVGRHFSRGGLNYNIQRSESFEIDNEFITSNMHSISTYYNLTESVEINLLFSRQYDSQNDAILGVNLGFSYYW